MVPDPITVPAGNARVLAGGVLVIRLFNQQRCAVQTVKNVLGKITIDLHGQRHSRLYRQQDADR
jgi:hypothetical protein